MSFLHAFGLLIRPRAEWSAIHDRHYGVATPFFTHTVIFALIPAVAGFYGTTRTGWQIGTGDAVRLTEESAARIAILYYLAMVGRDLLRRLGDPLDESHLRREPAARTVLCACDLHRDAAFSRRPDAPAAHTVAQPACRTAVLAFGYTIFIFYSGVPEMMEIPPERGFLFSSAVMAFGLVALVALLAASVLLWSSGFGPSFTN